MKIKCLLFALTLLLYNCGSTEKKEEEHYKINGSWDLSEVKTFDKTNLDLEDQTRLKLGKEYLSKGLTLYFFPDSTYTEIYNDKITHGVWFLENEKEVKFDNYKLSIEKLEQEEAYKSMSANLYNEDNNIESELKFIEGFKNLKDFNKDPFYPDNNKWRQKALKKETNKEISNRLSNYVLHNAYILKSAHDRNVGSVTFAHSRGLIRIYQGAIGILKEEKINKAWIDTYYDKEDAMKAYYLFKSYLGKEGVYKTKSSGDWVKDDYEILLALHTKIKETKEQDTERFKK